MLNRSYFFLFIFVALLSMVLISHGMVDRAASVQERPIVSLNALEQTTQMHMEILARLSEIHRETGAEVAKLEQQRTALMKEIAELTARREAETASLRQLQEQGSGEADRPKLIRHAISSATEREPVPGDAPSSENQSPLPEPSTALKSDPASTSRPRLLVNYSPNRERARTVAAGIVRQLAQNGYTVADMRGVNIQLSTPSIRYFYSDDRSATELASEIVSTSLGGHAPARVRVQNFTWSPRKPNHGTLELWIPVE